MINKNKTPNILLIILDCLGSNLFYKYYQFLPFFNTFSYNSLLYPKVVPTCTVTTPSISSILTGTLPFRHGIRFLDKGFLNKNVITIQEILQYNGYNTYIEATGPLMDLFGLNRGFDEYNYREADMNIYSKWGTDFLSKLDNHYNSPWFITLHLWELHAPRIIPNKLNSKYSGENRYEIILKILDEYISKIFNIIKSNDILFIVTGDHGEELYPSEIGIKGYPDLIKKGISRVFNKLNIEANIKYKNGGHGAILRPNTTKVPLYLYHNNLMYKNISINHYISHINIMPTILKFLNIDVPNDLYGYDLMDIKNIYKFSQKKLIYTSATLLNNGKNSQYKEAIQNQVFKYIYNDIYEELYNILNDPFEKKNIGTKYPVLTKYFNNKLKFLKISENNLDLTITDLKMLYNNSLLYNKMERISKNSLSSV